MTIIPEIAEAPTYPHGVVRGRYLRAVADTPADPGREMDWRPAEGKVTFTPVVPMRRAGFPVPALFTQQAVVCNLDPQGYLTDQAGERHVHLIAGQYKVRFDIRQFRVPGPRIIEITEEHTVDAPLDLVLAMEEPPPPPGSVIVVDESTALRASRSAREASAAADRAEDAAEQAETSATTVGDAAAQAREAATSARDSATSARDSATTAGAAAGQALGSSADAQEAARTSVESATNARDAADRAGVADTNVAQAAVRAAAAADRAEDAAEQAEVSATTVGEAATSARDSANTAEVAAQRAVESNADAQGAARTATESATNARAAANALDDTVRDVIARMEAGEFTGEPGKDGADWSKDQQAKVQGYWIVVSPTEPESGTYTTADGTVVPVVWQKPIEVMVPVVPEAPYFDKYALSIQVASLVGVDYYLTGFTKDGATVDVPDVKIPDGGILKLAGVSGKPALPYTVNVEARAEPGFKLPNAFTWGYSVVDPTQVVVVASDTFTGRATDPSPLAGSQMDLALGGEPKVWERAFGDATKFDAVWTVAGGKAVQTLGIDRSAPAVKGIGQNQRVEFDMTLSPDITFPAGRGSGLWFNLAGNGPLNGQARVNIEAPYQGNFGVAVYGTNDGKPGGDMLLKQKLGAYSPGQLSGRYVFELFDKSLIVTIPGMAPVTVPVDRVADGTCTWFNFDMPGGTAPRGIVTYDNFKFSKIGF